MMSRPQTRATILAALMLAPLGSLQAAQHTIENNTLSVTHDDASGTFNVSERKSGKAFLTNGRLEGGAVKAVTSGDTIVVTQADGSTVSLELREDQPFVFISKIQMGGDADNELVKTVLTSFTLDLGKPAKALKVQGTGGLCSPDNNPGSYLFLACADPATRRGVVAGWITEDRGSGVLFSSVKDGSVEIKAQIDYGRLRIPAGRSARLETLAIGCFDDARIGLELYADAIARHYQIRLPPQVAGYCTWYDDKYPRAGDEKSIVEVSSFIANELRPFGFSVVQIDDGWQDGGQYNGPRRGFDRVKPDGPYAHGMQPVADRIRGLGLIAGIWFMPFSRNHQDPEYKDRQHWFVKRDNGKPYETSWGGTSLDLTHPDVKAHLERLVKTIRSWGYDYFKMDGLWTGTATEQMYINDGYKDDRIGNNAPFHDPTKTNIEAYRDGLKLLREAAGPDVFFSGCTVSQNMRSFGGSIGLVDSMRTGPDNGPGGILSPVDHSSPIYFLNGRVWWNDPDPSFIRKELPLDKARLLPSWAGIAGFFTLISDWIPDLPADRVDIIKRILPAHDATARPVDYFDNRFMTTWLVTDTRQAVRRDVVAVFNWSDGLEDLSVKVDRIGLPPASEYVAFDFWANKFISPFRDTIPALLPGASCRIFAVRPVSDVPQLLSTSRHVTQGIVDVTDERWDGARSTLSGSSKVVENDRYELRVILPAGEKSWRATTVAVSDQDEAAGVKVAFQQDGPALRVSLMSPASRDVKWAVTFAPARIEVGPPPAVAQLRAASDFHGVKLAWADDQAEAYRIERDDGKVFNSTFNSFADESVENGTTYRYRVTALGWNRTPSPAATVEISIPKTPERPATPPAPTIHLGDLKPARAESGWGTPVPDKAIGGGPLRIDGKTYAKGVGVHSSAISVYAIPEKATRFVAVVGIDESQRDPRASMVFKVFGNVKEMGEKPVLIAESPVLCKSLRSWAFDLKLDVRFKEVHLVVTDAGDGNACDHADWVDAGFITATGR